MATTIASRKPYNFTHTTTDLNINIEAYLGDTYGEVTNYNILKTSYDPLVAEPLTVNLSPFMVDKFNHVPSQTPTMIDEVVSSAVQMSITGNIVTPQYYVGYDGWERYLPSTLAVSTSLTTRNIVLNSPQYITANLSAIENIYWIADTGDTHEETNQNLGVDTSSIFPVFTSGLTVTDSTKVITIQGRGVGNTVLWTLKFNIVCPYNEVYTIGFINRYGVWEYIDMIGNIRKGITTSKETYVRYDEGLNQNFNINGYRNFTVNTGWVDEAFEYVVNDLMLSEYIILYTGNPNTSIKLTLEDNNKQLQSSRVDKMINYSFKFKEAGPIIAIV